MLKLENNHFFTFSYIGEFYTENKWIHPQANTDTYELILMLKGKAYIEENGIQFELKENDMLILEPYITHKGFKFSKGVTSFYWLHFKTDMGLPFKYMENADTYSLKRHIKELLHQAHTLPIDRVSVDALSLYIYRELIKCDSINKDNAFLHTVYEYARINAAHASVKSVSEHFGYNPDYLSRIFKKRFNIGLKEFLSEYRAEMARDMLLTDNLPIKEIACKLNFESENAFIKFFVYHEKISPRKFKDRFYNTYLNNK